MKISRNNIAFSAIRSRLIRSRRTKGGVSFNTAKAGAGSKTKAATLAQKRQVISQSGKKTSTASTMLGTSKENYTKMQVAAQKVQKHLGKLLAADEKSIFAEAEESGNTGAAVSEITDFVQEYNEMVRRMKNEGGTVNELYVRQLHGFVVSNKSKLANIGITEDKNGLLAVDKTKLQEADVEKLKEVFSGEGSFADKVSDRSKKAEDNANTNLNTLNSATYSSLLESYGISGSKYNFKA